ncbi:MAG TPA: hypothetical protein VFE47_09960 [Tepidisphaeraceae bacterium]|jgi:hypothetical protein|nr:hypothetical protein [Tepidisphaeraceae bacterium]
MNHAKTKSVSRGRWTAEEVRRMQPARRDAILKAAALVAEPEYRLNADLIDFEAFGKDDIHGESSNSEPR